MAESVSATEDGAAVTGQLDATDIDGDDLTFSLVSDTSEGSVTVNADGTYSFDPGEGFQDLEVGATREVTFTYQVDDGQGGVVEQTGTVTVTGTNDGPVASDDTGSVTEDGSATFTSEQLLSNDSDIDVGDSFAITSVGDATHGTVSLDAETGEVTFTPDGDYTGPASFTYTITDEHGATSTATVDLTVDAANDDPVALAEELTAVEDTPYSGALTATDQDGDSLTYSLVDAPDHGQLQLNPDGSYTYTPDQHYSGPDEFTYQVSDGQGGTDTATITFDVDPVADTPVVVTNDITMDRSVEDQPVTGTDGDDTLVGTSGDDTLGGGAGDDVLTVDEDGGSGNESADLFSTYDHDLSNIVLYLDDGGGNITKVRIEAFDQAGESYNDPDDLPLQNFINENYPGQEMVAATVKAGNNFSGMGPGEGELVILDDSYTQDDLPTTNVADSNTYNFNDAFDGLWGSEGGDDTSSANDSFTVEAISSNAGYHNSYGYYVMDGDGNPVSGEIIWADVHDNLGDTATITGVDQGSVGFFIIPNGDNLNDGLSNGQEVTFQQDDDGNWQVYAGGVQLSAQAGHPYFSDESLNADGTDHMEDTATAGDQNWEDLAPSSSDYDFNDFNANVTWTLGDDDDGGSVGAGDDTVYGGTGSDTLSGGDGNDTLIGDPGVTDTVVPLDITVGLQDQDGSETLSSTVTITGLPSGATLSAGSESNGVWTVSVDDLEGLTMTVPADSANSFDLTVTATSNEWQDAGSASESSTFTVTLNDQTGDDTLTGGAGDDVIDGGAGSDTAIYSGPRENYMITEADGVYTVEDLTGADGTDTVTNIETFVFEDGSVAVDSILDGNADASSGDDSDDSGDDAADDDSSDDDSGDDSGAGAQLVSEDFSDGGEGWGDDVSFSDGKMVIGHDETATKTFDFGSDHANQTVVIEFDMTAKGGWEESGYAQDYFTISSNGSQIQQDSQEDGSTHYQFEVQTDENGQVVLELDVNTTAWDEKAEIDNFTMVGGDDWSAESSDDDSGSSDDSGDSYTPDYSDHIGDNLDWVYDADPNPSGDDVQIGDDGDDELEGGNDDDILIGLGGDDELEGDKGDDIMLGGDGADEMDGGKGDDIMFGGGGADEMEGGKGDDILIGGSGDDDLFGQQGDDLFIWGSGDGNDMISGGEGWADTIHLDQKGADGTQDNEGAGWTLRIDGEDDVVIGTGDSGSYEDIVGAEGTLTDNETGEVITFEGIEKIEW